MNIHQNIDIGCNQVTILTKDQWLPCAWCFSWIALILGCIVVSLRRKSPRSQTLRRLRFLDNISAKVEKPHSTKYEVGKGRSKCCPTRHILGYLASISHESEVSFPFIFQRQAALGTCWNSDSSSQIVRSAFSKWWYTLLKHQWCIAVARHFTLPTLCAPTCLTS